MAADRHLARALRDADLPADGPETTVTAAMLDSLESPRSADVYARDLGRYFGFCAERGLRPLAARREHVRAYAASLRDAELAPDTRRRMLAVVRVFYREAIEQERYAGPNPAERIGHIRGTPEAAASALTVAEVGALLDAAALGMASDDPITALRARRNRLLISTLLWLGLRAGEVTRIRRRHFTSAGGHPVLHVVGKGNKSAAIKLSGELLAEIGDYEAALGAGGIRLGNDDPLFFDLGKTWPLRPPRSGPVLRPLSVRRLHAITDAALAAIGHTERRSGSHLLRKTSLTLVYLASRDVLLAQRHGRHASVNTTIRHYIDEADRLAETGVDYLGKVLGPAGKDAVSR